MDKTRRRFLRNLSAGVSAMGLFNILSSPAFAARKPNFLFILADDMGWSDLACYGNRFHDTPNIYALRAQGMKFTDAYAACPVCSPTRASIMTGQYPARVGITDFIPGHWRPYEKLLGTSNRTQYLPSEAITIAEALKPAGYVSGLFGKWHLGGGDHEPVNQGFDAQRSTAGAHYQFRVTPPDEVPPDLNQADYLTTQCEEFLESNRDKPFCCFVTHYSVHIPLKADRELIQKYANKTPPETGVNNPVYAAMVEHVDRSVGRILKKLDKLGLSENTVVIFNSDNGGLWRMYTGEGPIVTDNAPLRGEKGMLYEGGIRVPLIVRWPGEVEPGSERHTPISSVDYFPTLLELAGERLPDTPCDGESLKPLLKQTSGLDRDTLYWHYPHYHHSSPAGAIRRGSYKLIEFYEDSHLELYNLSEDIGEKVNLAKQKPELAGELQTLLAEWRQSVHAEMPTSNPDFDPARRLEWGPHPSEKK